MRNIAGIVRWQTGTGKKGFVVEASGCHGDTKDSLTKGMDKVDSVMSFGYGNVVSSKNEGYSNFLAYPDSLINDFKPELESGDWLDKKTQSDDEIEIVVSKNPYGWKTGSHINLGYYDENGEIHSFKAMVCGVKGRYFSDWLQYRFEPVVPDRLPGFVFNV